jgi:hypothetical protein
VTASTTQATEADSLARPNLSRNQRPRYPRGRFSFARLDAFAQLLKLF